MNLKKAGLLVYCIFFACLPLSISLSEACVVSILILLVLDQAFQFQKEKTQTAGCPGESSLLHKTPVDLYVVLFLFFFSLSFLVTWLQTPENFDLSFRGFLKVLKWFIIFYGVVRFINDPPKIKLVSYVILLVVSVIVLNGIVQLIYGRDLLMGYSATAPFKLPRVRSSFSSDNGFATYLMMTVPFAVLSGYMFMKTVKNAWGRRAIRLLMWIFIALALICFSQTRTRGAWIASIFGLLSLFFVYRPKKSTSFLIVLTISSICLMPILLNGIVNNLHIDHSTGVMRFYFDEDIFTYAKKDFGRLKLWMEALAIASDHYWFGTGPNTYAKIAVNFKSFEYGGIYPHNSYLKLFVEIGFLAFLAFAALLASILYVVIRSIKHFRNHQSDLVILQAGVLIAITSFMAKSFVDTEIESLKRVYLFWLFSGLGFSISRQLLMDRFRMRFLASKDIVSVLHIGNQQSIRRLIGMNMEHQAKSGYQVMALTSSKAPYSEVRGVPVKTILFEEQSIRPVRDFFELIRLVKAIVSFSPDIVHTHSVKFGIFGRLAARIACVSYVIHTAHGIYRPHDVNPTKRFLIDGLEKIAGYLCDAVLFVSRFDLSAYVNQKIVSRSKASWIGNGIDLNRFNPAAYDRDEIAQKRKEIGVQDNQFLIGLVARLVKDKGCEEFFEAARIISAQHPNVKFLVVTLSYSRNDSISEKIVEQHGLSEKVIFLRDRDDMPILYLAMDLLVHPSWREGFPRSLMEASAMGTPCVVSDISGNQNVIENDVTGLMFEVKNAQEMSQKINWAMAHPQAMKSMAFRAQERAKQDFDQQKMFQRIDIAYEKNLSGAEFNESLCPEVYELASR